jgi:hypothetical protein
MSRLLLRRFIGILNGVDFGDGGERPDVCW